VGEAAAHSFRRGLASTSDTPFASDNSYSRQQKLSVATIIHSSAALGIAYSSSLPWTLGPTADLIKFIREMVRETALSVRRRWDHLLCPAIPVAIRSDWGCFWS